MHVLNQYLFRFMSQKQPSFVFEDKPVYSTVAHPKIWLFDFIDSAGHKEKLGNTSLFTVRLL